MSHGRQQIRDAMVVILTGLATTAGRVYPSRVYPYGAADLPGLAIFSGQEVVNPEGSSAGVIHTRVASMVVEGRAKAAASVDDTLDTIAAEVEAALFADRTLGGKALELKYAGAVMELDSETESIVGVIRLTFDVYYRVDPQDPQTLL